MLGHCLPYLMLRNFSFMTAASGLGTLIVVQWLRVADREVTTMLSLLLGTDKLMTKTIGLSKIVGVKTGVKKDTFASRVVPRSVALMEK